MRRIVKGREPAFLVRYRRSPGPPPPTFNGLSGHHAGEKTTKKARLRTELVRRQGGLCCYCQDRIRDAESTRIEHFHPGHDDDSPRALEWRNLWAACPGGTGLVKRLQHCDVAKGDLACSLDPAKVRETDFAYSANGEIGHVDAESNRQLSKVLNLNVDHLKDRRRKAMQGMFDAMARHKGPWTRSVLERKLAALEAPGETALAPYVAVMRFYLRKRLART